MKSINFATALLLLSISVASCSKWDDYKQYTSNGETSYTGKMESINIYPGRLRVKLTGLLPADPKISRVRVTWNNGADSAVYSITKGPGVDTFSRIINVPEGIVNFNVRTYDAQGNRSVVVNATGTAYGPKYEAGLTNRPVAKAEVLANGNAEITWDVFDTTTGARGTWISYSHANNAADSVFVPLSQSVTTLPSFKAGTAITIRTRYLPVPASIDTFYAATQVVGVLYDITSQYIQNAGINFSNSAGANTDRWQTPAIWTTTADVRNGPNGIGGIDNAGSLPSKALSIEAGYGLPAVNNGKIYQSFTLPAGKYTLVATTGDASTTGTKYITVAPGNALPDIANVTSGALVYKLFDKYTDNRLDFTLATTTQVSVGMQALMTNIGSNSGSWMKVFKFRLYGTP